MEAAGVAPARPGNTRQFRETDQNERPKKA